MRLVWGVKRCKNSKPEFSDLLGFGGTRPFVFLTPLSVLTKNQRPVKLHTTDCQGAGRFRDVMDSGHMAYTCSHTNVSKNLTTTDSTCCTRKDHMTNHHDNNHYEGNASLYLGTPTIFLNVFSFYARET